MRSSRRSSASPAAKARSSGSAATFAASSLPGRSGWPRSEMGTDPLARLGFALPVDHVAARTVPLDGLGTTARAGDGAVLAVRQPDAGEEVRLPAALAGAELESIGA